MDKFLKAPAQLIITKLKLKKGNLLDQREKESKIGVVYHVSNKLRIFDQCALSW